MDRGFKEGGNMRLIDLKPGTKVTNGYCLMEIVGESNLKGYGVVIRIIAKIHDPYGSRRLFNTCFHVSESQEKYFYLAEDQRIVSNGRSTRD